jgi:hypothetical protein
MKALVRIIASATVVAVAAVLALALLPGITASASVALRTPLELRTIASTSAGGTCQPGSAALQPPGGPLGLACFHLGGTRMTVTAVQSAYVRTYTLNIPVSMQKKEHVPTSHYAIFYVDIRLTPSGTAALLALSRDMYRQPMPHDALAGVVRGRVVGAMFFERRPDSSGLYSIACGTLTAAKNLLNELLHG